MQSVDNKFTKQLIQLIHNIRIRYSTWVKVIIAVVKHHDQMQLEEQKICLAYASLSSLLVNKLGHKILCRKLNLVINNHD